jgi:AraC family transcriptional regulator
MPEPANSPNREASSRRGAIAEMRRVLDREPHVQPEVLRGDTRFTRRWQHGEIHDRTAPMREHVVMTYYGTAQPISWRDGRQTQNGRTLAGTITLIPAGHEATWDVHGPIEVSHLYLSDLRLRQAAGLATGRTPFELRDRVAAADPILSRLLEIIALEAQAPNACGQLLVEQAIDLVSLQLLRGHSASADHVVASSVRGGLAAWQVRRVTDYLRTHLAEPVGLDELAALVGLSRFHFCTAFHKAVGMPPHRWLTGLRMSEAKRLLADNRLTVLQVAIAVGFQTQSAFAVAFRKAEGLSPSAYRRAL